MATLQLRNYSRASPWRAIATLFLDRQRYLHLAAEHEIAVSLSSAQYRAAHEVGDYPKPGWEAEALTRAKSHADDLLRGLFRSLVTTFAFAFLGLVVAFAFGKVVPSLPFAAGKVLSLVGALLAAWATLFELGGYAQTFDGQALHEVLHPVLFKLLFLPGVAIATLGQVWQ